MRQVPTYLLIGNGRVARSLLHYFTLLSLPTLHWHRPNPVSDLNEKIAKATHILVLIKDDAILDFTKAYLQNTNAYLIHCSGSLATEKLFGAHPLTAFNGSLLPIEKYQQIPFIVDENAPTFAELMPGLPNPSARLNIASKGKYHALCVMAGNFSCLLWQHFFSSLEQEFSIPASLAHPYLKQNTQALLDNAATALTGPLTRGDESTIALNLAALEDDPFQQVYQQFVKAFANINAGEKV